MEIHSQNIPATLEPAAELDRLGDEIADLSAHLEAACASTHGRPARAGWGSVSM